MIAPARLEHLEAIVDQIEQYENWEPKWDLFKVLMGICGTAFLFGLGILIPDYFTKDKSICISWTGFILLGLTIISFVLGTTCFIVNRIHHKERKQQMETESKKIRKIIDKVKELSIEN